ncbi:hypothetical protein EMPG_10534 [Blastomyces silverae]|uniref:Probable aspartic-type endopeptidase CTSD n=1 Tax=Blastomyces silverae TaxID=2060906 RepID=A0A0H1B3J6_9EURO|nr:hypothetical protein EMPG_10534 [Blastomyces silverae]
MRLPSSPWLLPLPLLLLASTDVVSAFFPYNPVANANANSKSNGMLLLPDLPKLNLKGLKERFYSYSPSRGESKGSLLTLPLRDVKEPVKLDIIKVRGNVRRQNIFKIYHADATTVPQSLAISSDGYDYSYFSIMYFGSERQPMWMLMDTGAANTWLISSNCTLEPCKIHNTFGSEDSKSLSISDIPFDVTYGTGKVSGILINDSIAFAGFDLPNVSFGSVLDMSNEFMNYPMDGILGLGRGPAYKVKAPTVMEELQMGGLLEKNIIGISLQRHGDGARDGQIVFGDVDKSKFVGDISYTKTVPNVGHWEVPVDDIFVDGKPLNFQGKNGIFDTGTSYVLIPYEDAKRIHDAIATAVKNPEWDTYWDLPCSTKTKIELVVSGVKYLMSPKDYVGETLENGMCRSRIVGHQPFEDNEWLLGSTFLKNVYTVFDFDENRIGLAMRAGNEGSSDPSAPNQKPPTGSGSPSVSPVGPPSEANSGGPKPAESSQKNPDSSDGVKVISISSTAPLLWISLFLLSSTLSPW